MRLRPEDEKYTEFIEEMLPKIADEVKKLTSIVPTLTPEQAELMLCLVQLGRIILIAVNERKVDKMMGEGINECSLMALESAVTAFGQDALEEASKLVLARCALIERFLNAETVKH
jgi:hypothetical protein